MTSTHGTNGRLGNQIFRNLGVSRIAEKFDLFVDYSEYDRIQQLGINLFVGKNRYNNNISLVDANYFQILNQSSLENNLNVHTSTSYFQTKEISTFLYNYLREESVKMNVLGKNPFKARYNSNNDVFIHIRLGDIALANLNIPYEYYTKALSEVPSCDTLYFSTDDKEHPTIKRFMQEYPAAQIVEKDEIATIQFANTCKHIILSHGSFSATIGYLSYYSTIHYPAYELVNRMWQGDIFSIPGWNKITL